MESFADLNLILLLGLTCIAIMLIVLLSYFIQLQSFKKRTKKYRFASASETRYLRTSSTFLSFGLAFFSYHWITSWLGKNVLIYHYFAVAFLSFIIGFAIGYALWATLKYYYPFVLEKRLNKIRFKPMKSGTTGRELRLLTESEEDVHLTEEMIEEEESFSADYDVWIDDETGEKVIEKYDTHYHALLCPNCNFRTLKDVKEEIVKEPTYDEEGELVKNYKCSYCGYQDVKTTKIASWGEEEKLSKLKEAAD